LEAGDRWQGRKSAATRGREMDPDLVAHLAAGRVGCLAAGAPLVSQFFDLPSCSRGPRDGFAGVLSRLEGHMRVDREHRREPTGISRSSAPDAAATPGKQTMIAAGARPASGEPSPGLRTASAEAVAIAPRSDAGTTPASIAAHGAAAGADPLSLTDPLRACFGRPRAPADPVSKEDPPGDAGDPVPGRPRARSCVQLRHDLVPDRLRIWDRRSVSASVSGPRWPEQDDRAGAFDAEPIMLGNERVAGGDRSTDTFQISTT
jgi:hypothetical protein